MAQDPINRQAQPPWETYTEEAALSLFQGNADALRLMQLWCDVSHTYDDLIDCDKHVPAESIHRMVWSLAVAIPENAFYQRFSAYLRPVVVLAINGWRAANEMEQSGSEEQLRIAHADRYLGSHFAIMLMELIGGHDYAVANARRARLMFQRDTWDNYRAGLAARDALEGQNTHG